MPPSVVYEGEIVMERGNWSRIGPITGLLAFAAYCGMFVVVSVSDTPAYVPPAASAEAVAGFLEAQRDFTRMFSIVGLVVPALLVLFGADLYERYRAAVPEGGRWIATTFLVGVALVGVAFFIQAALGLGVVSIREFGTDVQVARALHAISNSALVTVIPGVALMTASAAVLGLRFRALPAWLAVVALVAFVINLLAFWLMAWTVWVALASIVLLARPDAVGRRSVPGERLSAVKE